MQADTDRWGGGGGGGRGGGWNSSFGSVGLTILCDAALWVRSSSEASSRRDFSLGVSMGSDSIP